MGLFFKFLILVLLVFFATESQAQFKPAEQQYLGETNISINGGFEQGKTNWTNVNGTFAVGSTNKLFGQNAGCVTLTAQSLDLKNISVTTSMSGLQGYVSAYVKTNFPAQLCSHIDNVDVTCENIPYDNTYKQIQIPTVLGSTNLGVKLKSTSQTGTICVDNASFGTAKLTQDIAQAQLAFDVNIGGGNPSLGTANVTSYTEITNSTLDLVINKGSNLEIPCNLTNPSTGLTCSVGSESVGVVFQAEVGEYEICFYGSDYRPVANTAIESYFQLVETPNNAQTILQEGKTRVSSAHQDQGSGYTNNNLSHCSMFYFQTAGEKTIRLMYEQVGAGPGVLQAPILMADRNASYGQRDLRITGKYYPPKSKIVAQDNPDWFIDANIGGANITLAGSALTAYTEVTSATLDMVMRSGSSTAEIPCSSTNPSTGLTCSVGNESLGVVFTPPRAGYYDVCMAFTEYHPPNSNSNPTFQLIETPNNAQTILQEGGQKTSAGGGTVTSVDKIIERNVCGSFYFADTSERTVRLMYEYAFGSAAASIYINRDASNGQRDLRVTVRPSLNKGIIVGEFEQIKTTDLCVVEATGNDGESITLNTEDIPWKTEVQDPCGLWSNAGNTDLNTNDAYTARIDGVATFSGVFFTTSSSAGTNNVSIYKNGVAMNIQCGIVDVTAFQVMFSCDVPIVKNSVYTLRSAATKTLNNVATHRIMITERPDLAGIVKNLNDRIYQTISYTGNGTQISNIFRMATPATGFTNEGSGIIAYSDDGTNGTRLTALKKCKVDLSFTAGGPTTLRAINIRKNGNVMSADVADISIGGDVGNTSVSLVLNVGEYVDFYSPQTGFSNARFVMYAEDIL